MQALCEEGQWLVPRSPADPYGSCQLSPCPQLADGRHIYWNQFGTPGCYRSHTRGPCERGSIFVVDSFKASRARCVSSQSLSYTFNRTPQRYEPSYYPIPQRGPYGADYADRYEVPQAPSTYRRRPSGYYSRRSPSRTSSYSVRYRRRPRRFQSRGYY
jgi:hypothetical protein